MLHHSLLCHASALAVVAAALWTYLYSTFAGSFLWQLLEVSLPWLTCQHNDMYRYVYPSIQHIRFQPPICGQFLLLYSTAIKLNQLATQVWARLCLQIGWFRSLTKLKVHFEATSCIPFKWQTFVSISFPLRWFEVVAYTPWLINHPWSFIVNPRHNFGRMAIGSSLINDN